MALVPALERVQLSSEISVIGEQASELHGGLGYHRDLEGLHAGYCGAMIGRTLNHYRILSQIGRGGMGDVYAAEDTKLGRRVALKLLPAEVADDAERRARFEREARLLASLNHPNIATLFGFERHEKVPFLVMELIEGETLAQRLGQGALPRGECLEVLQQIAEGLEAAHESGVIHRDLKPANIKITSEGKVKLLDFGLAKALEGEAGVGSDASFSPTLTVAATQRGVVMGTASYMSPEQARGKPVDRRTDIWAFGCVLYECLTGRLAYQGETVSDTIALILQREPAWDALPADAPPRLVDLLRRCLEKDARQRLRDVGDARLEIEQVHAGNLASSDSGGIATGAIAPARARSSPAVLAGAFVLGLVAGAWGWSLSPWRETRMPGDMGMIRFTVAPPPEVEMSGPRISPDGSVLLFRGTDAKPGPGGQKRTFLYVRPIDSHVIRRIDATEGVFVGSVSPDSRWIAFAAPIGPGAPVSSLRKVPIDLSSPPVVLADWSNDWTDNLLWLRDGDIITFSHTDHIVRIPSDGGTAREGARLDLPGAPEGYAGAWNIVEVSGLLPDPSKVLVTVESWEGRYHQETHVLDTVSGSLTKLLEDGTSPVWSPTGHLLYTHDDTLLAVPFDAGSLSPAGGPVSLATGLGTSPGAAGATFALSSNGTLAHTTGGRIGGQRTLVTVGADGTTTPWSGDRRAFQNDLALSRGTRRLATTVMTEDLLFSIWISDVDRPRLRLAASMPRMDCASPVWMPDGDELFFRCGGREGQDGVYAVHAEGGDRPSLVIDLEARTQRERPASVTPDGRWLLLDRAFGPVPGNFLQVADLSRREAVTIRPLLPDLPIVGNGRFSPDGRWICYLTPTSGGTELYLRRFNGEADPGPPILAAVGEIVGAEWGAATSPGLLDLVYHDEQEREYEVSIDTREAVHVSDPRLVRDYSTMKPGLVVRTAAADGRLFAVEEGEDEERPIVTEVTVNWADELNRLAPRDD